MSYHVTKKTSNGYRCSCCMRTYKNDYWVEDTTEVFDEIRDLFKSDYERNPDHEILSIEVIDGSNKETMAHYGTSFAGNKSHRYSNERRWGYINVDPLETYEVIKGNNPGETWEQLCHRISLEESQRKLDELKYKLEQAQKEYDFEKQWQEKLKNKNGS